MSEMNDDRVSDEATGLPPLDDVDPAVTILLVSWSGSEGIATSPMTGDTVAVKYLSVRGLLRGENSEGAEWGQIHIAVPVEHVVDVAATLATGGEIDSGADERCRQAEAACRKALEAIAPCVVGWDGEMPTWAVKLSEAVPALQAVLGIQSEGNQPEGKAELPPCIIGEHVRFASPAGPYCGKCKVPMP